VLRDALDHGKASVRGNSVIHLGQIGPTAKDCLPRLIEMVENAGEEKTNRMLALDALSKIGPDQPEVLAALRRVENDPVEDVRRMAASALADRTKAESPDVALPDAAEASLKETDPAVYIASQRHSGDAWIVAGGGLAIVALAALAIVRRMRHGKLSPAADPFPQKK
jgi:HEAT repeat protein